MALTSPLLLGSVCGGPCDESGGECASYMPVGMDVYVTVFERWDENSTLLRPRSPSGWPRCEPLAFAPGDRVALRVTGVTDIEGGVAGCSPCSKKLAAVSEMTAGGLRFEPIPTSWTGDLDLIHPVESWDHIVVDPSCEGTLVIDFGLTNVGDARQEHGWIERLFIPDEGSCMNHPMAEGTPGEPPPYAGNPPVPAGCRDTYVVTALATPPADWPEELGAAPAGTGGASSP